MRARPLVGSALGRAAVGAAVVGIVVYAAVPDGPRLHGLLQVGIVAASAAACAVGIHRRGLHRRLVWRLVLGFLAACTVGDSMLWVPQILGRESLQSPSPADVFWLLAAAFLIAALAAQLVELTDPGEAVLDTATVAVGVALYAGVFLVLPFYGEGFSPGIQVIQTAYLVSDVLIAALATRLLLVPGRPRVATILAAVGALYLFSDVSWNWFMLAGAYVAGSWADVGWLASAVGLAAIAWHPVAGEIGTRRKTLPAFAVSDALLLSLAAVAVPLLYGAEWLIGSASFDERPALNPFIFVVGVGLATVVLLRLGLLWRRLQTVASELADTAAERGRLLGETEARYRNLVEELPAMTYLLEYEPDGGVGPPIYVSPRARQLLGYSQDECYTRGETWLADVHPEDYGRVLVESEAANRLNRPFRCEYRVRCSDGTYKWIENRRSIVRGLDGKPLYVQGFALDVTDRKLAEAERDRIEMELRLSQKLEAIGQLAAGIAHEINTPIQFVGDSAHFVREAVDDLFDLVSEYRALGVAAAAGTIDGARLERVAAAEATADVDYLAERVPIALERVFDGIGRVARIVRAMKEFAYPPSDDQGPVDLNEALESTLVVVGNELKYVADVELELGDLPPVVCNRGDMNQVFLNLLINAAHAIADVVEDGDRGRVSIRSYRDGAAAVFEIADSGTGIAEESRERVFDPFYTTKEVGRGTGQGLALARTIVVERHRGSLTFETAVGRGTTFVVRLPIAGSDRQAQAAA